MLNNISLFSFFVYSFPDFDSLFYSFKIEIKNKLHCEIFIEADKDEKSKR